LKGDPDKINLRKDSNKTTSVGRYLAIDCGRTFPEALEAAGIDFKDIGVGICFSSPWRPFWGLEMARI